MRGKERKDVLERGKNGKENKKGTYVRRHRENSMTTSFCVQQRYNNNNNNNIVISSVASKQQSDTITTQAGAWCLLELLANKHSYIHYISSGSFILIVNFVFLDLTKCNMSKH